MNRWFWIGFARGFALGPLWKLLDRTVNGDIIVTMADGIAVCVTRQNREGKVLEIIWEAPSNALAQGHEHSECLAGT